MNLVKVKITEQAKELRANSDKKDFALKDFYFPEKALRNKKIFRNFWGEE